jgi:hypothetical protein
MVSFLPETLGRLVGLAGIVCPFPDLLLGLTYLPVHLSGLLLGDGRKDLDSAKLVHASSSG